MSTNIYRRLLEILPNQPVNIGTITTVNSDKTATVTLVDGGIVRVANPTNLTTGKRVFVQGDAITNEAPNLPIEQGGDI